MTKRILLIANSYPNASHSYVNNDVEYLSSRARVLALSKRQPPAPFYSPFDFNFFDDYSQLELQARQFKPDFVLSWMLPNHFLARRVSEALDVPFALKTHTPDIFRLYKGWSRPLERLKTLVQSEDHVARSYRISMSSLARTARSPKLRGVYTIPALRPIFEDYFDSRVVFDMLPRFYTERFLNPAPNGGKLLVAGSLVNRRENQLTFADVLSSFAGAVDWFPVPTPGCLWMDVPYIPANVHIRHYAPPADMPATYKAYKAMLVIGRGKFSRGLSMSIIEAQAAGVAVIAPSLRPDFDRFVLDGGGYLFKDESEIPGILARIPEPGRRELGYAHAGRYDIAGLEQELALCGLVL